MDWFTACVLYALIWWTVLFAVLPFGTRARRRAGRRERLARRRRSTRIWGAR